MNTNIEDEGPACAQVADGEAYIHDVEAFMARVKGIALMVVEGVLFVLDAESLKWRNVEGAPEPKRKAASLVEVPKK